MQALDVGDVLTRRGLNVRTRAGVEVYIDAHLHGRQRDLGGQGRWRRGGRACGEQYAGEQARDEGQESHDVASLVLRITSKVRGFPCITVITRTMKASTEETGDSRAAMVACSSRES